MVEIVREAPLTPEEFGALVMEWHAASEQLASLRASEMLLRQRVFKLAFPEATEGTNKLQLGHGYSLTATVPYSRDVDEEAIASLDNELKAAGIAPDALVKRKPSLDLKLYRTLTAEQAQLFDRCLTIKPGSPALKLVEPK